MLAKPHAACDMQHVYHLSSVISWSMHAGLQVLTSSGSCVRLVWVVPPLCSGLCVHSGPCVHLARSPEHEPLLRQCLLAVRSAALMELRAKARVLVPNGACLMGVPDETGELTEGCVFLQVSVLVFIVSASVCLCLYVLCVHA